MIFFLFIVGVSFGAGELMVRRVDNPYSVKMRLIKDKGKKATTVFLGNSHTFYGLRADLWPDMALNLSNVSQPLAYDRRIIETYIDSMPALKNVVMQISCTSLFDDDMEKTDEWWRCISYQLYMNLGVHPRLSKYSAEISYLPVYSEKLKSIFHISSPQLVADSLGNGLGYDEPLPDNELESTGKIIAAGHSKGADINRLNRNLAHLEAISNLCKQKGINLVFFTQPEFKAYRDNVDSVLINKMIGEMEKFAEKKNLSYINLYEDKRFDKTDFYDADHLNHHKGAVKLTAILADTIR
ncbi:MAG: hypothetical protein K2G23_00600 [Muribaculaceae bacterium]|nr:hypothetical protein [Muribaculaceae bacterium]